MSIQESNISPRIQQESPPMRAALHLSRYSAGSDNAYSVSITRTPVTCRVGYTIKKRSPTHTHSEYGPHF